MYVNNQGPYQPNPNYVYQPVPAEDPTVNAYVDSAFSKALAATIMAEFPIASIIAISFGSTALDIADRAKMLAQQRGVKPSGKVVAATILGKIGKIVGIVMTVFWAVYLFIFMLIFSDLIF